MNISKPAGVAGRVLVQTGFLAAAAFVVSIPAAYAADCEALMSAKLPNTSIISAQSLPAGTYQPPGSTTAFTDLPAFCRVTATVHPVSDSDIGIEVWLPTTTWNGRYQQVGNHGWAGTIYWSEMAPQLRRGFATAATDDGHVESATNPFEVTWGFGHPAKIDDFAWRAVHELAEQSKRLIVAYYGRPANKAYFNGCSDGGREGLREAHDFPKDFDGILAGGVASGATHGATEQLAVSTNLINSGVQGTGAAAILALTQAAATKACGEVLRGVADGLIINPERCHWDPHALLCKNGQDPAACLTPAQADAIEANNNPLRDPVTGKWVFSGMSPGSEFDQLRFQYNYGAPIGVGTYQLGLDDPTWAASSYDLHAQLPRVDRVLGVINLTNPDLRPFEAAGGKLIEWQGWDDAAFTPGFTTHYYNEVIDTVGRGDLQHVQRFYRLFMLPGVGHCGTGIGPDDIGAEGQTAVSSDPEHDAVTALLDWVENDHAPVKLIATKFKVVDEPDSGIDMQRPICPYPAEAVYNGSGNIYDAMNFSCKKR